MDELRPDAAGGWHANLALPNDCRDHRFRGAAERV